MIKFLVNTVGATATSIDNYSSTTGSGYKNTNLISGERNELWRDDGTDTIASPSGIEYRYSSGSFTYDFVVVGRADYAALSKTAMHLLIEDTTTAGGASGYTTQKTYGPVLTSDLVGKEVNGSHGQDLVWEPASARTSITGLRLNFDGTSGTDTQARQCSKFYAGEAFDLGCNPMSRGGFVWEPLLEQERDFKPIRTNQSYDTEARVSLVFEGITKAKFKSFETLTKLLDWPFFLWDENAEVFPDKLEHVLVENYVGRAIQPDNWTLEIVFRRLAHHV